MSPSSELDPNDTGSGSSHSSVSAAMSMWEDIASSIKKLDPDHADVLLASTPNCLDSIPGVFSNQYISSHPYTDDYDQGMMVNGTTVINYGGGDSSIENGGNCVIVISDSADPYDLELIPSPSSSVTLPSIHSLQQQQHQQHIPKNVNMSGGFVCSTLDDDDPLGMSSPRKTPPPSYQESLIVKTERKSSCMSGQIKYNRRNNPDLEKRRIHFCDHPGTTDINMGPYNRGVAAT